MSEETLHILVVDDEPDLRELYELTLMRQGYRVHTAGSVAAARAAIGQQRYAAVISDMRLPDGLGLEVLAELQKRGRSERAIVITAYGSAENAVEALKAGAFDYISKPVDLQQLRSVVAAAVAESQAQQAPAPVPAPAQMQAEVPPSASTIKTKAAQATLTPEIAENTIKNTPPSNPALDRIIGSSAPIQTLREHIAKAARGMAPILIRGESGTGKELAAQAVHACSQRAAGPFVAVNCGAIPESLLEAEFFGARKGSYTGAATDREGFFQAAHGGTLFLDEIGDLPLAMQAKLLRVIQERQVRPLGAVQEERIDARLVSATHKDLAAEVRAGRFRQDLFYRLNVIEIRMPALRERREDLHDLVQALLQRICAETGQALPRVEADAMEWLRQHPLPGNVRELENLLHRALALCGSSTIAASDLHDGSPAPTPLPDTPAAPPTASVAAHAPADAAPAPTDLQAFLDQQEREVLVRVLRETHYNRTLAAARLGLNLRQIRYRIQRLQIPMPGGASEQDEA